MKETVCKSNVFAQHNTHRDRISAWCLPCSKNRRYAHLYYSKQGQRQNFLFISSSGYESYKHTHAKQSMGASAFWCNPEVGAKNVDPHWHAHWSTEIRMYRDEWF